MKSNFKLVVFFLLLGISAADAQVFPSDLWHEGKIVRREGDTLRGLIKYDLQNDLVQYVVKDQQPEVYTARKILFFEIFDQSVNTYRQFFTLPFTVTGGYKAPIFFELLEEGKMTLLSREILELRTYSSPYAMGSYSRMVMIYRYFFLKENGDIEEFTGNRNDLLTMMGRNGDDVEKYIKKNRLRFEEKYDFAKIIAYYNSLTGT